MWFYYSIANIAAGARVQKGMQYIHFYLIRTISTLVRQNPFIAATTRRYTPDLMALKNQCTPHSRTPTHYTCIHLLAPRAKIHTGLTTRQSLSLYWRASTRVHDRMGVHRPLIVFARRIYGARMDCARATHIAIAAAATTYCRRSRHVSWRISARAKQGERERKNEPCLGYLLWQVTAGFFPRGACLGGCRCSGAERWRVESLWGFNGRAGRRVVGSLVILRMETLPTLSFSESTFFHVFYVTFAFEYLFNVVVFSFCFRWVIQVTPWACHYFITPVTA